MVMQTRSQGGRRGNPAPEPYDFSETTDAEWAEIIEQHKLESKHSNVIPENESRLVRIGRLIDRNADLPTWKALVIELDREMVEAQIAVANGAPRDLSIDAEDRAGALAALAEIAEQDAAALVSTADGAAGAPESSESAAVDAAEVDAAAAIAEAKAERLVEESARPVGGWSAPVSVRLQYPFSIGEQEIAGVEIAPPTYGTVERLARGEMETMAAFAAMTGLSPPVLRALRMPDADRVFGAALDMLPDWSRRV